MSTPFDLTSGLSDARSLLDWLERHEEREHRVLSGHGGDAGQCAPGRRTHPQRREWRIDVMHFAEELSGRNREDDLRSPRRRSVTRVTSPASPTNYGFEEVFARGVEAWPRRRAPCVLDVRQQRNLIRAAEAARARGVKALGLLGSDRSQLWQLCELSLIVPGVTSDRIQEIHIKAAHLLIAGIEHALFAPSLT